MSATYPISVVIPALSISCSLKKLLSGLDVCSIHEFILVLPNSVSRTSVDEELPISLRTVYANRGRGAQIQAGIDHAQSPYILILHADSELSSNCVDQIYEILKDEDVSLGCFQLKIGSQRLASKLFSSLARFDSVFTTFGDQGFFFRREDFQRVCPDLSAYPLMEDMVIRQSLRKIGRVRKSKYQITTSPYRFEKHGFWKAQWMNFIIILRFLRGECPRKLYAEYYNLAPKS